MSETKTIEVTFQLEVPADTTQEEIQQWVDFNLQQADCIDTHVLNKLGSFEDVEMTDRIIKYDWRYIREGT